MGGGVRVTTAGRSAARLTALHQLGDPVGRGLALSQVELDFEDGQGEARDLGAQDGQGGVAVPPAAVQQYRRRNGSSSSKAAMSAAGEGGRGSQGRAPTPSHQPCPVVFNRF